MSRNFTIPLSKTYNFKFDFLVDNKITEIDSTYNVVEKKEEKREYKLVRAKEVYEDGKNKIHIEFDKPNDVHGLKNYVSRTDDWTSEFYMIHLESDIRYDFENILFNTESIILKDDSLEIANTIKNEKDQSFEYDNYYYFMSHYDKLSDDDEWHSKARYTLKENENKTIDVYINIPTMVGVIKKIQMCINYTIKILGYSYISNINTIHLGESKDNNSKRLHSISANVLGGNINYKDESIGSYLANRILGNYSTRKRTIEIEMPLQKLYNKFGYLVYDDGKGEIPEINDVFTCIDDNRSSDYTKIGNIRFKVLKVEFNYNGVPKLMIKGKEV